MGGRHVLPVAPSDRVLVALLRGINVGGHKKVPMAELRELATAAGLERVRSYVQSGNLVFLGTRSSAATAQVLEEAISAHFGFEVDVIGRTGAEWLTYSESKIFSECQKNRPNLLMLALSKSPMAAGVAPALLQYAVRERVDVAGEALWIDYADGSARSKITPAVLRRVVGSPVTTRNWRTVQAIAGLVRECSS